MDFGETLKLWEGRNAKSASPDEKDRRGKAERSSGSTGPSAISKAQEAWLDRYGTDRAPERDTEAPARRLSGKEIEAIPIDGSIDLHGMTSREAEAALESFFATAERMNYRKVLIVHGKGLHSSGAPVLSNTVRLWLERRKSVGRIGKASKSDGGGGATWAILRNAGDQRSR